MNLYVKVRIKNIIKKLIGRSYHISFKNIFNKERYYIIRRPSPWAGFFANYLYIVGHIEYAMKHHLVPVVDMENYPTLYTEEYSINNTLNGWEYFFEQPNGVTLVDAYRSNNYILSDSSSYIKYLPYREGDNYFKIYKDKVIDINSRTCSLINIRPEIVKLLEMERKQLFDGVMLGVHVRGTDKREIVKDHHVAASLQEVLDIVLKTTNSKSVDRILLCCDEEYTVKMFKSVFEDRVVVTNAYRATEGNNIGVHLDCDCKRLNHKYQLGYEVLRDCYLLSKCDYLIFGHSNVTNTAIIWNNGNYKETYFVENNLYK